MYVYTEKNESDELREATKEDYPQLFFKELCFDGTQYTIRPVNKVNGEFAICEVPGKDSPERTFSYLMHYVGESQSASGQKCPRVPVKEQSASQLSYNLYLISNQCSKSLC